MIFVIALALTVSVFADAIQDSVTRIWSFNAGDSVQSGLINENFKTLANGSVPIGTIVAWHKDLSGVSSLPTGWKECNGSTVTDSESPLVNQTLPNLNGELRFLRGSSTSGTLQGDAFQGHGHTHRFNALAFSPSGSGTTISPSAINGVTNSSGSGNIVSPVDLSGYGTVRFATETRPVNMSVVWIMRIK